jgi:hypothetical protein
VASEMSERFFDFLIERLRAPNFPSAHMMNRVEAAIEDQEQLREYLEVLFEKVEDAEYPSQDMLNRIQRLTPLAR